MAQARESKLLQGIPHEHEKLLPITHGTVHLTGAVAKGAVPSICHSRAIMILQ